MARGSRLTRPFNAGLIAPLISTGIIGPGVVIPEVLQALGISLRTIASDAAPGSLITAISNALAGSALAVIQGGAFIAANASGLVKGARTPRPGYFTVTVRETKGGQSKDTTFTLKSPRSSVLVEDFEDLSTGWANATASPAIVAANPSWALTGKQSMRLAQVDGATGSVRNIKTLATPIAMDASTNIDFACFVEDVSKTSSVGITLTNNANQTVTFTFDNLSRGAQRLTANIGKQSAAFLTNNGVPATITKVQCSVFSYAQGGGAASFDDFRIGPKSISNGMMQVDDNYVEQFTVYKPMWEAAGIKGWLNLESDRIGVSGAMTLAQLQQWVADGHYVGNHGDGTPLPDLSQADAEANLQACMDAIKSNGLSRDTTWDGRKCKGSEFHLAYPNGVTSATTEAAMRSKGVLTGATVLPRGLGTKNGVLSPFGIPRIGMTSRTSAAIIADIQACLDHGRDFIVFAHTTSGTPAAVMQDVVNFLKAQWDAGNLFMTNMLDWYNALPQTPLPAAGVNLAGGEFGGRGNGDYHVYSATLDLADPMNLRGPSPNYAYPTAAEVNYYADRGVTIIRCPIRYHHLFQVVSETDPTQDVARTSDWTKLNAFLDACANRGVEVIIDMHEYGYQTVDGDPSNAAAYHTSAVFYQNNATDKNKLAKRWVNIASRVKSRAKIRYGLMNEPTNKPNAPGVTNLFAILQAVMTAVATEDPNPAHVFHICGWGYSSAAGWVSSGNAAAFLTLSDPRGGKPVAEVHQYLDVDPNAPGSESHPGKEANPVIVGLADSSGSYDFSGTTYPFTPVMKPLTDHARANGYLAFLGEYAFTQDEVYSNEGRRLLRYIHENRDVWNGHALWGPGPFWQALNADGSLRKPFSPEPRDLTSSLHLPQMNVLSEFLWIDGVPQFTGGAATPPVVTLGNLMLSANNATVGTAFTATISGKTSGSTITLSGAGAAGLSVSGATVSGTPTTAGPVNLVETLAGATGSPKPTADVLTVSAAVDGFASSLYDLNFRTGTYKGATLANLLKEAGNYIGGQYELESDGSLVSVAANVIQRTANGLEVWPDRTNYALQSRNLTDAAWTKTGLTAARSTGRTGTANAGSRITVDQAGGAALLAAITLSSRAMIAAIDIQRVSGTGGVDITMDGGATWASLSGLASSWRRLSVPSQTLANPQFGLRFATAGDVFDIDYVQLENSGTVGPRIATTTAANNRPQNRATCLDRPPLVDLIKSDLFTAYWEGRMDAAGGRGVFISDAGFTFAVAADGSCAALGVPAGEFKFGIDQKVAFRRAADGTGRCSVNGGPIRSSSIASCVALTHFDISTNGNGAANIRGVVRRCAFWNTALADADLQALTA